ncbi:MAG: TIGR03617 family F420-dependent LLM class oxidoreductase [Myxococcota bacterium]
MRIETIVPLDDWRAVAPVAKRAEEAGYDGIGSAEIAHDPFIPLAFAAVATERIRLGTGIAVAFPRSPMVVAHSAWDLQTQSGGRFALGIGSQVKGHNERRFSVPWGPPVPRLREYIQSLRAIWRCWEKKEPLRFEGEHYHFTLMTPEFSPSPSGQPPIPISIAAVGPAMMKLAGRHCDGVKLHGFATRKYLEEVALPQVQAGLEAAGRSRASFEISGGGFVATGANAEALAKSVEEIRYRIGFYGSTRSYHGVLRLHGWEDLGLKLHEMSKKGQWQQMAKEVPDDVVHTFAAVGTFDELKNAVETRFGDLTDTLGLGLRRDIDAGLQRELVRDLQSIPASFETFPAHWD